MLELLNDISYFLHIEISTLRHVDPHIARNASRLSRRTLGQFVALSLNFTITEKQLRSGADSPGVVSLKCTAEVLELYWRSSSVSVTVSRAPAVWYSTALSSSHHLSPHSTLPTTALLIVASLKLVSPSDRWLFYCF